jgi:DNA replication and repair protein RecF
MVLVVGPNGAGKTNLLEALHLATQGFSPRTHRDNQLIRFGERSARVAVKGVSASRDIDVSMILRQGQAKETRLNGAPLSAAELLRRELKTLVFTPDRLAVVKGGPAARRSYLDRVVARLLPARASLPQEYAAALAQRNASLRRVQLGLAPLESIAPWTARIAAFGADLVAARTAAIEELTPGFGDVASRFGLASATLRYDGEAPGEADLAKRLGADVSRGATSIGPHLDDVSIERAARDLRRFGTQGEQRLALLALILAEWELLVPQPLLLLDDVLSELDPARRRTLAGVIAGVGQTVITTTDRGALPADPAQIVEVSYGTAR